MGYTYPAAVSPTYCRVMDVEMMIQRIKPSWMTQKGTRILLNHGWYFAEIMLMDKAGIADRLRPFCYTANLQTVPTSSTKSAAGDLATSENKGFSIQCGTEVAVRAKDRREHNFSSRETNKLGMRETENREGEKKESEGFVHGSNITRSTRELRLFDQLL